MERLFYVDSIEWSFPFLDQIHIKFGGMYR